MEYSLDQSVGFLMGLTHRKAAVVLANRFKPYDITTEQFSVLFNIGRGKGSTRRSLLPVCAKTSPRLPASSIF